MKFFVLMWVSVVAGAASAMVPKAIEYAPKVRCTPFGGSKNMPTAAQQKSADALIAAFEKAYPPELVNPSRVETASIPPAALTVIVEQLACLSTHPGADPFVPEQAAALFASRRYGKSAFALLAKSRNARFAAQMRSYTAVRR